MSRKAVFLDKDGTIVPETGARTADVNVRPVPEAVEAIRKLRAAGFVIVVVTNQAAIARGYFTESELAVAHKALLAKFDAAGAPIDAVYYCPHLPDGTVMPYAIACGCRKPKPGLLLRAAEELRVDLTQSYMIGDGERDILAARAVGCKGTARVRPYQAGAAEQCRQLGQTGQTSQTGRTGQTGQTRDTQADAVFEHVRDAADWVLAVERGKRPSPLRLAVLLSGGGTTLENLFAKIEQGSLDARVEVVIASRPDAYGLERAKNHGGDAVVIERKKFADTASFSAALNERLERYNVELVCLAGFMVKWQIPDRHIGRAMNIHPALIPAFCGKGFYGHFVHEAVIEHGAKVSGCTVHFVDRAYDHGPIIVQKTVPVLADDTPETLAARVFEKECEAYPEAVQLFAEGRLRIDGQRVRVLTKTEAEV